ncbi:MAG: hypothetical protein ABH828_00685 [archaeon]
MKKKKKTKVQLYNLFNELSYNIENQDELGVVIGYAIVAAISSFKNPSQSPIENKFREMKSIYIKLNYAIDNIVDDSYDVISKFQKQLENKDPQKKSKLLHGIIKNTDILDRNINDKLRRKGVEIYHEVRNIGELIGKYSMIQDYNLVERIFTQR